MLTELLEDDLNWNPKKIQEFISTLTTTQISSVLQERVKKLSETKPNFSKVDFIKILNELLQQYYFGRTPENTGQNIKPVLLEPFRFVTLEDIKISQERYEMNDFDLKIIEEQTALIKTFLNDFETWLHSNDPTQLKAFHEKTNNLVAALRATQEAFTKKVATNPNLQNLKCPKRADHYIQVFQELLNQITPYQNQNNDTSITPALLVELKGKIGPIWSNQKADLDKVIEQLNFIFKTHDHLIALGILNASDVDFADCDILIILGASFPPLLSRTRFAVPFVKDAKMIYLATGQRDLEEGIDLGPYRKFLATLSEGAGENPLPSKSQPKTEAEMACFLAKSLLKDHFNEDALVDAPKRLDSKGNLTVRPDTTWTIVHTAKKIAEAIAAGKLNPRQKINVYCVTEAPNFGPQYQQVRTGLQTAGIPAISENLDNFVIKMIGPGSSYTYSSKAIYLALSSLAGEVFAVKNRPVLKPERDIKQRFESMAEGFKHEADKAVNSVGAGVGAATEDFMPLAAVLKTNPGIVNAAAGATGTISAPGAGNVVLSKQKA